MTFLDHLIQTKETKERFQVRRKLLPLYHKNNIDVMYRKYMLIKKPIKYSHLFFYLCSNTIREYISTLQTTGVNDDFLNYNVGYVEENGSNTDTDEDADCSDYHNSSEGKNRFVYFFPTLREILI